MVKRGSPGHSSSHSSESSIERKLLENLIELQKIHADQAEKFDKLAKHIESLLTLFEVSARSFAQHPGNVTTEKDREFLEKIDKLLDQNKVLAKGLTLMEERIRERVYGGGTASQTKEEADLSSPATTPSIKDNNSEVQTPTPSNRPLPRF